MTLPPSIPRRFRYPILVLAILSFAAAFVASHIPADKLGDVEVSDKTLHLVGYLGLAGMLMLTMIGFGKARAARVLLTMAAMAAYGAADEITQPYFQRNGDVMDFAADMIGSVAAIALVELVVLLRSSARGEGRRQP